MDGRVWKYFTSNPLVSAVVGTVVGTLLATWLLAWHWSDVKPYLALVWDAAVHTASYLSGTVQVGRGTVLALLVGLLVFAVALAYAAAWWQRRAPPRFDAGTFEWTKPRRYLLKKLLERIDQQTDIDQLHGLTAATPGDMPLISKAQIARDMEDAERAGIVHIERTDDGFAYYGLTQPYGRNWLLDKLAEEERAAASDAREPRKQPRSS